MDNNSKILPISANPQIWFEAYHDVLFRFARVRLGDADLAEEKIQDTFLAALKSCKNFKGLASEKTWLLSILKRKIYDHIRRMSRERQFNTAFAIDCFWPEAFDGRRTQADGYRPWFCNPSMVYEQKEFLKIIQHALSELPGRQAQVFILREVIELSSREICEYMGISVGNLFVMMHRARKRLSQNRQLKLFLGN